MNLYSAFGGNPVNVRDSMGMQSERFGDFRTPGDEEVWRRIQREKAIEEKIASYQEKLSDTIKTAHKFLEDYKKKKNLKILPEAIVIDIVRQFENLFTHNPKEAHFILLAHIRLILFGRDMHSFDIESAEIAYLYQKGTLIFLLYSLPNDWEGEEWKNNFFLDLLCSPHLDIPSSQAKEQQDLLIKIMITTVRSKFLNLADFDRLAYQKESYFYFKNIFEALSYYIKRSNDINTLKDLKVLILEKYNRWFPGGKSVLPKDVPSQQESKKFLEGLFNDVTARLKELEKPSPK